MHKCIFMESKQSRFAVFVCIRQEKKNPTAKLHDALAPCNMNSFSIILAHIQGSDNLTLYASDVFFLFFWGNTNSKIYFSCISCRLYVFL